MYISIIAMSFLEELQQMRRRPISVTFRFRILSQTESNSVFLFVEGPHDQSFFLSVLRRVYSGTANLRCLVCDGKSGVLDVHSRVQEWGAPTVAQMYFVDKDVDDLVDGPLAPAANLYVTTYYAIESCLVSSNMLAIIWDELFKLPSDDSRKELAIGKFRAEHGKFMRAMRIVMGWIIWRRRTGQSVTLADVNLDKHFYLNSDMGFARRQGAFGRIRRQCGKGSSGIEWIDVRKVCKELQRTEPKEYVRGKFELWFFVKFVTRLEQELRNSENRRQRPKNSTTISTSNAVDLLAARCPISARLESFLKANLTT